MSLTILMADDHEEQIKDACLSLRERGHIVHIALTYKKADELIRNVIFDIVVIDLGWPDDKYLQSIKQDGSLAGYDLVKLAIERNPKTFRIIYTVRADEISIVQAATSYNAICVKKVPYRDPKAKYARMYLAYVVSAIALVLSDKKALEEKLSALQIEADELKQFKQKNDQEKQKFRRILGIATITPTVSFVLSIVAWYFTQQEIVSILGFLAGGFFTIAIMRATGVISHADLKSLGEILTSLFRKNTQ